MRKTISLVFAVLALGVWIPTLAIAADDDVKGLGPLAPCVDIIGANGRYGLTGNVSVQVRLAAPGCSQFTYTVYIVTTEGTQELEFQGFGGDNLDVATFTGTVDPDTNPVAVDVYATTSAGRHVFDRGPDTGSVVLLRGSDPAWSSFN